MMVVAEFGGVVVKVVLGGRCGGVAYTYCSAHLSFHAQHVFLNHLSTCPTFRLLNIFNIVVLFNYSIISSFRPRFGWPIHARHIRHNEAGQPAHFTLLHTASTPVVFPTLD